MSSTISKRWVLLAQGDFKRYREEERRSADAWSGTDPDNTKFNIDLWKHADPGLLEVEDAQKRLALLQNK